jgi:hypothetical protein
MRSSALVLAAETLHKTDLQGEITVIGVELESPCSRMAFPIWPLVAGG